MAEITEITYTPVTKALSGYRFRGKHYIFEYEPVAELIPGEEPRKKSVADEPIVAPYNGPTNVIKKEGPPRKETRREKKRRIQHEKITAEVNAKMASGGDEPKKGRKHKLIPGDFTIFEEVKTRDDIIDEELAPIINEDGYYDGPQVEDLGMERHIKVGIDKGRILTYVGAIALVTGVIWLFWIV